MRRLMTSGVRKLLLLIAFLIVISSVFYHYSEGWSAVDSVYFTVLTITTVGHGELVPTTTISKLFTASIAFIGIAMVLTLFGIVSSHYVKICTER